MVSVRTRRQGGDFFLTLICHKFVLPSRRLFYVDKFFYFAEMMSSVNLSSRGMSFCSAAMHWSNTGVSNSKWLVGHMPEKKCSADPTLMEKSLCELQISRKALKIS